MRTIFKYPVLQEPQWIPNGATILHAGLDPQDVPCVWAMVDSEAEKIRRDIRIIGTGWDTPENFIHIGTFIAGPFVWHVCEFIGD